MPVRIAHNMPVSKLDRPCRDGRRRSNSPRDRGRQHRHAETGEGATHHETKGDNTAMLRQEKEQLTTRQRETTSSCVLADEVTL